MDTTHSDTFGKQEFADYNPHYGGMGFQPKLAFDANGFCLGAMLCKGSEYSSTNIVDFVKPIIQFLKKECGIQTIIIRGDSGFATPDLYDFCEKENI
ncbi:hypothetical protein Hs30E_16290 [Lactococcus hodotermopsidis]|uniref:Transposase DDE domain-containing protein n=1 Tax=Pseudolactococcus hodotermopsidis TaxID=2709157 RepID=A0A6A0BFF5_9LACT|nr:hypothetical protein Hs30E_16290 [Lactococcus hodotermopsidis]